MNFGDSLTKLAYMAKGQMGMQQTVDEEYDLKKKRFANYEQQQKEIKTHVQNLAKHFSAISSTLGFIAECSSKLYEENDQTYRSISKLTQIVNDIEQHQLPLFVTFLKEFKLPGTNN
jgi:exonuclease VII small subunit